MINIVVCQLVTWRLLVFTGNAHPALEGYLWHVEITMKNIFVTEDGFEFFKELFSSFDCIIKKHWIFFNR